MRRWSPDAEARAGVAVAAGADPTLMHMVQMAGLLGEEATMAERTTEYLCSGGWPGAWVGSTAGRAWARCSCVECASGG